MAKTTSSLIAEVEKLKQLATRNEERLIHAYQHNQSRDYVNIANPVDIVAQEFCKMSYGELAAAVERRNRNVVTATPLILGAIVVGAIAITGIVMAAPLIPFIKFATGAAFGLGAICCLAETERVWNSIKQLANNAIGGKTAEKLAAYNSPGAQERLKQLTAESNLAKQQQKDIADVQAAGDKLDVLQLQLHNLQESGITAIPNPPAPPADLQPSSLNAYGKHMAASIAAAEQALNAQNQQPAPAAIALPTGEQQAATAQPRP